MQLTLTDEGATALEEVLGESLSLLRTEIAQSATEPDRARLGRKATFIRKILQQLAARGLTHSL